MEKKKVDYQKQGKKNRAAGGRFELKVRKAFEELGYILDKWTNNVDFELDKIIPAKRKFNPFSKVMSLGTGFPDFIAISHIIDDKYDVIGVEVKMNGYLDAEERKKARWYLDKKVFSKFYIAKTKKDGRKVNVELINFDTKYPKEK